MQPKIQTLPEKKLVGKKLAMTFAHNRTGDLWRSFMPRRKEISNAIGTELYSLQIYPPLFFDNFDPDWQFEKWAAVEVADLLSIPEGMEPLTLPGGLYAVFPYKGTASAAANTFNDIFGIWLPKSAYTLDDRPHFELLGEKYRHEDPNSEEEIWIPIKLNP